MSFVRIQKEVVDAGLCTHCGTCVGLSNGTLRMQTSLQGPLPVATATAEIILPDMAYLACPGKGFNYPDLNTWLFGRVPENWLVGHYRNTYIGYTADPVIRQQSASGGVITQTLLYLLSKGWVDGAVVLRQGFPKPWLATPVIATTAEEIQAASQSVYIPIPVNTIMEELAAFKGKLAYVGLPDQVAALRKLQQLGHPGALKVDYVLGPYVGTAIYQEALESFLRSQGQVLEQVAELRYRSGEWPGKLRIRMQSGQVIEAAKFYYNYLIPFFITQSSLITVDFTNELTDISVGDAWHPRLEAVGGGYSVVVVRSDKGAAIMSQMQEEQQIVLDPISLGETLAMHGHMLDFKKRGAFIRLGWRRAVGKRVPEYGYAPDAIPLGRKGVELVISGLFWLCKMRIARYMVAFLPLGLLGPTFEFLRSSWKSLSKPTKRKGLAQMAFQITRGVSVSDEEVQTGIRTI